MGSCLPWVVCHGNSLQSSCSSCRLSHTTTSPPPSPAVPTTTTTTASSSTSILCSRQLVFTATNCTITRDHVEIVCTMGPGVGNRLQWTVVIGGQSSSSPLTSYRRPEVTSVGILAPNGTELTDPGSLNNMDTRGGQVMVFRGNYFGPLGAPIPILATGRQGTGSSGGLTVTTSQCRVASESHDVVQCLSPPGAGVGFAWSVTVAVQASLYSAQVRWWGLGRAIPCASPPPPPPIMAVRPGRPLR